MENFYITLIRDEVNHNFFYVDGDKQESEHFYEAGLYKDGFANVRTKKGAEMQYRDMLGRLSSEKTASGKAYYEYVLGMISYEGLAIEHFADQVFCIGVKQEIIRKAKQLAEQKYNSGKIVSKKEFEKAIEKTFKEIDLKHELAVEILQSNAEIDAIYQNNKNDVDEYEETMGFLDDIDV